jgi:phage gp36-like protein
MSGSVYQTTIEEMAARLTARTLAAVTDDVAGRTVDETLVAEKIRDAEALFHTYAGVYYLTPIAEPPENVRVAKKVVIDLAAWELLSRRPHAISGDVGETERTKNDATLSWLRGLAARDRRVQLTGSPERTITAPPSGGATVVADEPQFTAEALTAF